MGALTLNSCVDDTENIGVTNVRQAKAAQIKAVADYNKSLAEKEMINANTIKAAKEAIAEYNNALAKAEEARAAVRQAEAEGKAAEAEQAKIDLQKAEMDLENYAKVVELAAAKLDQQLLNWQMNIVQAKKDLADAIKKAQPDEATELQKLLDKYTEVSGKLSAAQVSLERTKLNLEQAKAGLISTKEGYENLITGYQNDIKTLQEQITGKEDQLAVYEGYTDVTEAKKALDELSTQLTPLWDAYQNMLTAREVQNNKLDDAYTTMSNSAYVQDVRDLLGESPSTYWNITYTRNIDRETPDPWSISAYKDNWNAQTGVYEPIIITLFNGINADSKKGSIEYSYEEGQWVYTQSYDIYSNYYTPVKDGFTKLETAVKADIAAKEGKALTDAQTAQTTAKSAQTAAAAAKTAADAVLKAAKDAVTAAGNNATDVQKQAVKDAEADVEKKAGDLKDANDKLKEADDDVKDAQDNLAKANKQLADVKALYDTAIGGVSTNEANMKAYNEQSKKLAEAFIAAYKASNAYSEADNQYNAYNGIINRSGSQDILANINSLKADIEDLKEEITKKEAHIKDAQAELAKGDDPDKLKLIQEYESKITELENSITVLQKAYDIAKAALDAAMAEDAPAE